MFSGDKEGILVLGGPRSVWCGNLEVDVVKWMQRFRFALGSAKEDIKNYQLLQDRICLLKLFGLRFLKDSL